MKLLLHLIKKDLLLFFKDKVAMMLTYFLPLMVIFLFGSVLGVGGGGVGGDNGPSGPVLIVVNQSEDPLVESLIEALYEGKGLRIWTKQHDTGDDWEPFTEELAREWITGNRARFGLVFPENATSQGGPGLKMTLLTNPRNEVEEQIVKGLLQQQLFMAYPKLLITSLRRDMSGVFTREDFERFNTKIAEAVSETIEVPFEDVVDDIATGNPMRFLMEEDEGGVATEAEGGAPIGEQMESMMGGLFSLEEEQLVGQDVRNPQATRLIAGWAVMFLLFSLTGAASALFDEKKAGIFYRLFSGPVTRDAILYSKFIYLTLIGISQLVICFLAGWVFFRVDVFPFFFQLLVVSLVVGGTCTAFGMFLSSISRTSAQANGFGTMLVLTMSAVGGAWFPTSLMPDWVQVLSKFTLVYWAVEAFQQVLWNQTGIPGALPYLGMSLLIMVGVMALATWRFRVGQIFS